MSMENDIMKDEIMKKLRYFKDSGEDAHLCKSNRTFMNGLVLDFDDDFVKFEDLKDGVVMVFVSDVYNLDFYTKK